MKKILYLLILNVLISVVVYSQQKTHNEDFYSYWKQKYRKSVTENSYKLGFEKQTESFIDSLRQEGIDTIGGYIVTLPGWVSTSNCDYGTNSPWTAYVQWEKTGKAFQKEFTQSCQFHEKSIEIAMIIRYYLNAYSKIDKEIILPVITKIYRFPNGKIKYYVYDIAGHTPDYSIFCLIKNKVGFQRFYGNAVEDKTNLFYKRNIESTTNSWRKMIDNQLTRDN